MYNDTIIDNSEMAWGEDIVYGSAGPTRSMAPRPPETVESIPLPQVSFDSSDLYRNVADVVDKKAELIVKPEDSLRVMKVIDLAFRSHEEGRSIKCEI